MFHNTWAEYDFGKWRKNGLYEKVKHANMSTCQGVLFTTVGGDKLYMDWPNNWLQNILSVDANCSPLIIVQDPLLQRALVEDFHVPDRYVFLDVDILNEFPWLAKRTRHAAVETKWVYTTMFVSWGFRTIFSDVDVYFLAPPADLQTLVHDQDGNRHDYTGLSDWRGRDPICVILYRYIPQCGSVNHCFSTGLSIFEPTAITKKVLEATLETMRLWLEVWEQRAWNTVSTLVRDQKMPFRIGMFDERKVGNTVQLKVLFNANIQELPDANMKNKVLAVHLGFVHGAAKKEEYKALGYWRPVNTTTEKNFTTLL